MDFLSSRLQTLFPSAKKLLADCSRFTRLSFAARLGIISALLFLIWIFACQRLLDRHYRLQSFAREVSALAIRAEHLEKQKKLYEEMHKQSSIAADDYLHQVVEKIPLLQEEKHRVARLAKRFADNLSLKERISFLDSDQNQIHFEEVRSNISSDIEYHLAHRVQMDKNDLRNFLEAVEGARYDATQGKPFLLMKKFELLKCYEKGDEKVYSIHVELLQK